MRITIKETKDYILFHHMLIIKFNSISSKDFKYCGYSYFIVKKRFNKHKTTMHNTLEEVKERIKVLLSVPIEIRKYHI